MSQSVHHTLRSTKCRGVKYGEQSTDAHNLAAQNIGGTIYVSSK